MDQQGYGDMKDNYLNCNVHISNLDAISSLLFQLMHFTTF